MIIIICKKTKTYLSESVFTCAGLKSVPWKMMYRPLLVTSTVSIPGGVEATASPCQHQTLTSSYVARSADGSTCAARDLLADSGGMRDTTGMGGGKERLWGRGDAIVDR